MATDIVGSLFGVTPEVLQQRQMEMADRQAMEYAQLSPLQRASYGLARGGYQLAGALGGQDPQLRMISNRNAIARQIDPTNLESMQMGIQALQQAGDPVGAMQLAQVFRQAENDMALRSQREAAAMASRAAATRERSQAVPASIQEANRISQITQALQTLELQPYERMALEAEMQQLRKTSTSDSIAVANRIGDLTRALADPNLPDLDRRVLQAQYDQLTKAAGQKPNVPDAIQVAQRISGITRQLQNPDLAPIERMALEAEMTQLRKTERESAPPASLQLADAISSAQARVDELESQPESPERDRALAVAKRRVENLERQAPQPRTQTQSPALQLAADIENTQALVDALQNVPASAERDATLRRAVTRLDALQRQLPQQRVEKPESFGPDREATSRELFGKAFGDLTQDQQAAVNRKLARPESFGTDREAISREMFSKSFAELTQTQQASVNRKLEQEAAKRAPTVQNILPGQPVPQKDWIKFEEYLQGQPTFKQTAAMISAAPGVLRVIRQSTSNDFASRALPTSIARLFEQGTLSNQDVSRYARTGGLDDRLAAMASEFFTGRVTSVTKEQAERFMSAVYRGALLDQRAIYVQQADRLGYSDSSTFKKTLKQLDDELAKFRPQQPAPAPGAGAAPGAGTAPGAGGRTMSAEEEAALLRRYNVTPR
jgi:RNA polymerase-interacting CarD/CdnL/TRCF family regulator